MRAYFGLSASFLSITVFLQSASGTVTFGHAVSADDYTLGTVYVASGDSYTNITAALGKPSPIVGANSAYAGVLSPFNGPYETSDLVQIGRGGSLTLQLASPVPAAGANQIGVFTSATFSDYDYPNGLVSSPAHTSAFDEYGAERTAVVEVAQTKGNFHSIGRVVFDTPTNYFTNITDPFQYPPPVNAKPADFGQPFTRPLSDFSGQNLAGVLNTLNGSAGGNWITVPGTLGISAVNFIRLSDPLWVLPDGSLAATRSSIYSNHEKPADLFIDAVAGVPGRSGDSNNDGIVDTSDFTALAAHFNDSSDVTFANGDFNGDGVVNILDFNELATHYGTGSSATPGAALGTVLVPEPGLGAMAIGATLLVGRRRRSALFPKGMN